ncbi:MAG: acylneuraminate cytidylyltransferase family protein [Deltaproteobacteria bacterium]|nr:acylneuraminate cytidylyltransferase family protein [Deltaproteobacteria bacterium]
MESGAQKDILGLIPARGGSKSIPLKNIVDLHGIPLMSYVINAGKGSKSVTRLVCSTDSKEIAGLCEKQGVEVMARPIELAQDHTHVVEVVIDVLSKLKSREGYVPFAVVLLQPTSPFVLPGHIDRCIEMLRQDQNAGSVQTITKFPHNYHAFNQRVINGNKVHFVFREERRQCYNKQKKPIFHCFGNIVVTRTQEIMEKKEIFAEPSLGLEIPFHYALDVDGPEDLEIAEWYLQKGKVIISH